MPHGTLIVRRISTTGIDQFVYHLWLCTETCIGKGINWRTPLYVHDWIVLHSITLESKEREKICRQSLTRPETTLTEDDLGLPHVPC
jgi:hypothetical protein